jgi:hypothetical protein
MKFHFNAFWSKNKTASWNFVGSPMTSGSRKVEFHKIETFLSQDWKFLDFLSCDQGWKWQTDHNYSIYKKLKLYLWQIFSNTYILAKNCRSCDLKKDFRSCAKYFRSCRIRSCDQIPRWRLLSVQNFIFALNN